VIRDELRLAGEELRQRLCALRPLEDVLLVDTLPREVATLLTELRRAGA
jgi:hypothetical protein